VSRKYDEIVALLDGKGAKYEIIEHGHVVSVDDATKETGIDPKEGAKALVLKTNDEFVLCVVRGTNKLDYKKVREILGVRKLRFATPEEVFEVMGVNIGACYPFGSIAGIKMLVDETLAENKMITFSPGVHDKHVYMEWGEYVKSTKPSLMNLN
jgi:Ala-tRNA(Pro) deacylase